MTFMTMGKRTRDAFDERTLDRFGIRYLEIVMENWRESEATMRRTLTFAGVLVVIFFLLAHARNAEVSFGPLKLTNVAAVLALVPPIVAILGHEWVDLLGACDAYERVWNCLVMRLAPSLRATDLDALLLPPTVHAMGRAADRSWTTLFSKPYPRSERLLEATRLFFACVVVFGSIAFFIYAYIDLYGDRHTNAVATSVSLAVTSTYAVRSITLFFVGESVEDARIEKEERQRGEGVEAKAATDG